MNGWFWELDLSGRGDNRRFVCSIGSVSAGGATDGIVASASIGSQGMPIQTRFVLAGRPGARSILRQTQAANASVAVLAVFPSLSSALTFMGGLEAALISGAGSVSLTGDEVMNVRVLPLVARRIRNFLSGSEGLDRIRFSTTAQEILVRGVGSVMEMERSSAGGLDRSRISRDAVQSLLLTVACREICAVHAASVRSIAGDFRQSSGAIG